MKAAILFILSVAVVLPVFGFVKTIEVPFEQAVEKPSHFERQYADGKELLALVETEEEAMQIAEIYAIELVGFSNGVATYHTEEAPGTVVERGKENDWPEVFINYTRKAF